MRCKYFSMHETYKYLKQQGNNIFITNKKLEIRMFIDITNLKNLY